MNALRPQAVVLGFVTDLAGTWIAAALVLALDPAMSGMSVEDQSAVLSSSPLMFSLGAAMTLLGGFVAGQFAPGEELSNAFAVGALSTAFGFLNTIGAPPVVPFEIEALGLLVTIPLACGGGLLRAALRSRA